ncbi:MAG: aminoglycoside phosphotransferase family protein [Acidimicrobiia bacterium]|nr:aminoglycoside phosphotransferase family protein [Acidimicrobiia bacterium]
MTDAMAVARARKALADANLPMDVPLERADSVTNEVWLAPRHVVRINRHPNQRLRREAFLGPRLPRDVGYPGIAAYGGRLGADWLIQPRRPGRPLSRCWPLMTVDERRRAVRQLAAMLKALHTCEAPPELPPIVTPQLLSPTALRAVDPLLEGLAQIRQLDYVDTGLVDETTNLVLDLAWVVEPFRSPTLIHGDLHFENVLWDGYVVTALVDFEYARAAPGDLDLDVLLRCCAFPYLHVAEDYEDQTHSEDYASVPWWLAEDYPELFAHPHLADRCRIYSVAYDVADLLTHPPMASARALSPHHALNRLERVLRRESHIDFFAGSPSAAFLGENDPLTALHSAQVPDGPAPLSGEPRTVSPPLEALPRRDRG